MAKEFEIDVAGSDLLSKNYSIVVSERNVINVKGFKFDEKLLGLLKERHFIGKSDRGQTMLKIRVYCIVIYYLFKSMKIKENTQANLHICRDFSGHERDISSQLKYLLENLLKLKINISYGRLGKDSDADKYAYVLSSKDTKNLFNGYVNISLEDIEIFLSKNDK